MTTIPALAPPSSTLPPVLDERPVPFTRTTRVELRKMVDTRAGVWLLAIVTLSGLAMIVGTLIWGGEPHGLNDFLGSTVLPLSVLLPVVGIMAATAEWSQRTGLVTFTLEPRRGRVVAAKLVASVLLGLGVFAAALLAAIAATLATGSSWDLSVSVLAGLVLAVLLFVLQGVAFGFALLNTPAAIVAALLLPTVWTIAGGLIPAVQGVSDWLNLNTTTMPLMTGEMTGTDWAKLGTSVLLWVGVPLAIGTRRVLTREVK
ncbi:MAG TPA: hypothetical protein VIU11_28840 [Nakamurella sp.]